MSVIDNRCAIYFISLKSAPGRLNNFLKLAQSFHLSPTIIEAIDGKSLSDAAVEQAGYQRVFTKTSRALTRAEVGCLLSHRKALTEFLNSDHEFSVILEDDAVFNADFVELLPHLCAMNGNWEVLKLENREIEPQMLQVMQCHQYQVFSPRSPHLGSTAILYTRSGAQKTLNMNQRFSVAFDTQFKWSWQHQLQIFQIYPSLVWEVNSNRTQSTIGRRAEKAPFDFSTMLQRRWNRWLCDWQKLRFARKLKAQFNELTDDTISVP